MIGADTSVGSHGRARSLIVKGLRVTVGSNRAFIGHRKLKRITIPYPLEDETELKHILQLQQRLAARQGTEGSDE